MSAESYEEKLAAWKKSHGVMDARPTEDIPSGELKMMAEDAKSTLSSYCWLCGDEFLIREMVIETSPYNQMDEEEPNEDGYVSEENRVRKCKACEKQERDEENGLAEGEEP